MINVAPVAGDVARILRALTKVSAKTHRQAKIMPYRSAVDFQFLVIHNLTSQRFAGGYTPYSEIYQEWKLRQKLGMQFWKLYGDLVQNIKVFKVGTDWMAGVTPGVRATVSSSLFGKAKEARKVLISQYALWMEFGRRGQPARPLFRPTKTEYRRGGFIIQGQKSLRRIMMGWS
jgi:hypothetical protein